MVYSLHIPVGIGTLLLVVLLAGAFSSLAAGAEFTGKVVAILDGEIIAVKHDGRPEQIRLHGVECPDQDKRLVKRARAYLAKRAMGQTVTVVTLEPDREGRMISDVYLPTGEMLNTLVIQAGYAWTDGTGYGIFSEMEDEARLAHRGMWAKPSTAAAPAAPLPHRSSKR
jgi:micrococcal nuclease